MWLYRVWHDGKWIIPHGRPCAANRRECLRALAHGKKVERQYLTEWISM